MKKRGWVKALLWVIGAVVFVILTPELRDLVLFIMLGILLSRANKNRPF